MQQPLFPPAPARALAPSAVVEPDLTDGDGVTLAWALAGKKPVFAGDLLDKVGEDRDVYACVDCRVPVLVVLPRPGSARKIRPHFRHARASRDCSAASNDGAMRWNVAYHLWRVLRAPLDLSVRHHCTPHGNPWSFAPLLTAGEPCEATDARAVHRWERVTLDRNAELRLHGPTSALAVLLATSSRPPARPDLPWVEVDVNEHSYRRLLAWDGSDGLLPVARAGEGWRCPRHRSAATRSGA